MAGVSTSDGSGGIRTIRSRPHWWVVLAVSLSLLALVAAATAAHRSPLGHRPAAGAPPAHSPGRARATPPSPAASTTTTAPDPSPHPVTSTTEAPATPPAGVTESARVVRQAGTTTPTSTPTTPTTTPTTTPAGGSGATDTTTQTTVATDTQTGALQQPDAASASYAFAGDGSMVVSATWEPDATLSLSVTCPAGTQTQEGTSSISIEIADANGPCDVRLKEMIVQYAAVSYTVTVAPEDGS